MKKLLLSLFLFLPIVAVAYEVDTTATYKIVDKYPEFPGGHEKLMQFIKENLHYPDEAKALNQQGRVICEFTILTSGALADIEVVRSSGYDLLDKEALRIIQTMPKWEPGEFKGTIVKVRFTLPILFKLDEEQKKSVSRFITVADPKDKLKIDPKPIYTQVRARSQPHETKEAIVVFEDPASHSIMAPNGVLVSINKGFTAVRNVLSIEYEGVLDRISPDSIRVSYYDTKKNKLHKIEHYLIRDNNFYLDGEQIYISDNKPICKEIIKNGKLRQTIWLDTDGKINRIYMYNQPDNIVELQLYPSGAPKLRTDYFGSSQSKTTAYSVSKEPAAIYTQPEYPGGYDTFERDFNIHSRLPKDYADTTFFASVQIHTNGTYQMQLLDGENDYFLASFSGYLPKWKPATIDGNPAEITICRSIRYNPIDYLGLSYDTLSIRTKNATYVGYRGLQWILTKDYSITSLNNALYGLCRRNMDTLYIDCYEKPLNQLVATQTNIKNTSGEWVNHGWKKYFKLGKIEREEYFENGDLKKVNMYDADEHLKYEVFAKDQSSMYAEMKEYYPSGVLKIHEIIKGKKCQITYYNREGKKSKAVMPSIEGGEKALNAYLKKNVDIKHSDFYDMDWQNFSGWAELFIEVDENGKIVSLSIGDSEVTGNYNIYTFLTEGWNKFFKVVFDCIRSYPKSIIPGTIDNKPETLKVAYKINLSYSK